jgi:hypothetical protein
MSNNDLSNPYRLAIQKYLFQILGNRYTKYHDLVQRMTHNVVTTKDATDYGQMLVEIYEVAYLKAVEDYRKNVEAHGFKIDIVPSTKNS